MPRAQIFGIILLLLTSASGAGADSVASESLARNLTAGVAPEALEARLAAEPARIPETMRALGDALLSDDAQLVRALQEYLPRVALAYARRVSGSFSREQHLALLTVFQLVDPMRYLEDPRFRARVDPLLPRTLDAKIARPVRDAALRELSDVVRIDFTLAETCARAWGFEARDTAARRIAFDAKRLRMPDDLRGPIEASFFSINSAFFTADEARTFLAAVRRAAPKRRIVVLTDLDLAMNDVDAIDSVARAYTPWPRDPFTIARTGDGGVLFVNRPNLQPDREEDVNLVRGLIQKLPKALDDAWRPRWTVAPVPFHNGHILLTPDAAWISLHTVEIRALAILGLTRVPVETLDTAEGVARYQTAVRQAADELSMLYQRPVRFVHPLEPKPERMRRIAGGGGFDLDSLVTLLPGKRTTTALVGDIALGAQLAREADWTRAHAAYGFTGDAASLGARMAAAQSARRTQGLAMFLDAVAESLAARGMIVRRIPLLNVPASMIAAGVERDFLLTWNNVVLERSGTASRAEGFASLVEAGDAIARAAFRDAGYALDLYPPLVRSIVLSGGYRCASNHLRAK
ncbi:MAG TPA: hypothetical protein VFO89_09325 [Thermoanaerobaculia bacterium]|nr:hypothetical protein [Thermoanaerobaculia bacterium]